MKVPSLSTVEGLAVLGVGIFVAYVVYKSYKAGEGIVESVKETVMGAVHTGDLITQKARTAVTGGTFGTDPENDQYRNETEKFKRQEQDAAWRDWENDTPQDDVTPYNAMGDFIIGQYSGIETVPQFYSPDAVGA